MQRQMACVAGLSSCTNVANSSESRRDSKSSSPDRPNRPVDPSKTRSGVLRRTSQPKTNSSDRIGPSRSRAPATLSRARPGSPLEPPLGPPEPNLRPSSLGRRPFQPGRRPRSSHGPACCGCAPPTGTGSDARCLPIPCPCHLDHSPRQQSTCALTSICPEARLINTYGSVSIMLRVPFIAVNPLMATNT